MTADEQTIESLQQQLLEAQESSRHLLLRAQGAEAREQALEAHVALTAPALREARLCLGHARVFISSRQKMHECGREAHDECVKCLDSLIAETPETSLAHRDAEVAYAAVKRAVKAAMPGPSNPPDDPPAGFVEFCEGVAAVLEAYKRLRRQAEEDE